MEFLVEFKVSVPHGTPESEVMERESAEASAAARLVDEGHLVRLWKRADAGAEPKIVGLYRAESEAELNGLLRVLPLYDWMHVTVSPLGCHPNDPAAGRQVPRADKGPGINGQFPKPRLTKVYRLEAALGPPFDLGDTAQGHRRIAPLASGTFTGPEINGTLVPGASADWQTVLPDGTTLGDIRYTLLTDAGDVLYVQSRSVRHGPAETLARLARGEDVDPSEYTFRASTQIVTAALQLDWLNKGIFISVAGRQPSGVIYETYLVG
jgi:muconolactone delta-isomerase